MQPRRHVRLLGKLKRLPSKPLEEPFLRNSLVIQQPLHQRGLSALLNYAFKGVFDRSHTDYNQLYAKYRSNPRSHLKLVTTATACQH